MKTKFVVHMSHSGTLILEAESESKLRQELSEKYPEAIIHITPHRPKKLSDTESASQDETEEA